MNKESIVSGKMSTTLNMFPWCVFIYAVNKDLMAKGVLSVNKTHKTMAGIYNVLGFDQSNLGKCVRQTCCGWAGPVHVSQTWILHSCIESVAAHEQELFTWRVLHPPLPCFILPSPTAWSVRVFLVLFFVIVVFVCLLGEFKLS